MVNIFRLVQVFILWLLHLFSQWKEGADLPLARFMCSQGQLEFSQTSKNRCPSLQTTVTKSSSLGEGRVCWAHFHPRPSSKEIRAGAGGRRSRVLLTRTPLLFLPLLSCPCDVARLRYTVRNASTYLVTHLCSCGVHLCAPLFFQLSCDIAQAVSAVVWHLREWNLLALLEVVFSGESLL